MCARPERRVAWFNTSEMPPRAPVMSATAISPVSPSNAALMRALTRALSASMPDQALRSQGKAPASFKD